MNRKLAILFSAVLIALPVSALAFTSCRDTDKGCTLEQLVQLNNDSVSLGLATSERIAIMQEMIAKLTALIGQLQTSSAGTPSASSATCLDLPNNLIIGSRDSGYYAGGVGGENYYIAHGMEVSALQQFLGISPTGYYGSLTAAAVMKWQKAHGMDFVTLTSGVGPMTRAKMKCGSTTSQAVQKISWNIEKANPSITDPNDYHQSEQAIAVDVTFADNSTKRYNLGTAYGCTGSTVQSTENGKTVLGKINCYYSLTGVGFVAYSQNGRFIVERGDESAKDGSVKTTVLLQI